MHHKANQLDHVSMRNLSHGDDPSVGSSSQAEEGQTAAAIESPGQECKPKREPAYVDA